MSAIYNFYQNQRGGGVGVERNAHSYGDFDITEKIIDLAQSPLKSNKKDDRLINVQFKQVLREYVVFLSNLFTRCQNFSLVKIEAFADDKFIVSENIKFVLFSRRKHYGGGGGNQKMLVNSFLFFSQCYQKAFPQEYQKSFCGKR